MAHEDKDQGHNALSVVGDIAKVADTSVMKDLLGRAFKAVGDYYGEQVEEYFNQRRKRRWKNVRDHEAQVAQVIGEPVDILTKPERAGAIERWVEIAADVPLEDAERAALFEAVLAQILSTHGSSDFQDVAEQLSSSGMRVLLNAPFNKGIAPEDGDRQGFERLRSLGLARTLDLRQALAVIFAWVLGTAVGFFGLFFIIPRYLPRALAIEFVVEALLISAVALALGIALLTTNYRLTEFGKSLQQSALRFYRDRSSLRKVTLLSAIPSKPLIWGALAALFVCTLPPVLDLYFPAHDATRTVIISSPPANPSLPGAPTPPPPGASAPSPQQVTLTADEIRTLIDVWRSVAEQMSSIILLTNQVQSLLPNWPQRLAGDRGAVATQLLEMRDQINQRRVSIQSLHNFYQKYPNVRSALQEANVDGVFARLYRSLDSFAHEIQILPTPPPENFENTLRPYAGELKAATDAMAIWANNTRGFANAQSQELPK